MRLQNTFEQCFRPLCLFLLINICFGQEHQLSDFGKLNAQFEEIDASENSLQHLSPPLPTQSDEQRSVINEEKIHIIQTDWHLPKSFESSAKLIENQLLRFLNLFPQFLQTNLFKSINDHTILTNTIWFGSICFICLLFGLIFLSINIKRSRQRRREKEIRIECQQLHEHRDQMEFEWATFKRKHQKLLDEMDERKRASVSNEDNLRHFRQTCAQLQEDLIIGHIKCDNLQKELDYRQVAMEKHELDVQQQLNMVAHLNGEILGYQQELEKERLRITQLQSGNLSFEHFENLQEVIHQLQQVQGHASYLDINNSELRIKIKEPKELLAQRDEIIARVPEEILANILSMVPDVNLDNTEQHEEISSTINNNVKKANQHMRDLHSDIEEKSRHVKEIDALLNQEKDRCRELETKLKVVLELRERDAHQHIRQLGQTDAELRKARTDTERVRILQQQLELKQQQLDDVQKVLASEQSKFSEECSKLQHETHEKWMEVKRVTRELDGARKECEGLRRQITRYAHNDRSSQEKTMHKPVAHHLNNTGRLSSEPETNGSSPPPLPYQQDAKTNKQSIGSSTTSPVNMFSTKPPSFVFLRPFFHPLPPAILPTRFSVPFKAIQQVKAKDNFLFTNKA